ncbi:MAG: signal peptidase I [Verrucomicrobia bacterium]|nr:signal peptidase I [Verrucomicrobiota bacterium]
MKRILSATACHRAGDIAESGWRGQCQIFRVGIGAKLSARRRVNTFVQNDTTQKPPGWLRVVVLGRHPRRTFVRLVVLGVLCFVVFKFILLPIRISGESMSPTYRDGQFNLVNRLAYLRHEPQRGDVVSISLAGPSVMFMKRIIALPGETVAFAAGRALVNGQPLAEPYLKLPCDWNRPPVTLGADEYFVLGDNRSMPMRDHTFGVAARRKIVGKVLL